MSTISYVQSFVLFLAIVYTIQLYHVTSSSVSAILDWCKELKGFV